MKKVILFLVIFIAFFIVPKNLDAEVSTYTVYTINNLGEESAPTTYTDYSLALAKMNSYEKNIDIVSVIKKDGTLVNAKYAVAKLNSSSTINIYNNSSLSGTAYTYVSGGDYGIDAAFLDYDTAYNTVKIKISGYAGWVRLDQVKIVPLSTISTQYVTINSASAALYTTNTATGYIKTLQQNAPYVWDTKAVVSGVTWYHISEPGTVGWVSSANSAVTEEKRPYLNTYYVRFNFENASKPWDLYHSFGYRSGTSELVGLINLGIAPTMLDINRYYYSFDGNYFYTDFLDMLDDYKSGVYTHSINATNPYYNYYLYLPNHSKTGYTAENFDQIISNTYTSNIEKKLKVNASNVNLKLSASETSSTIVALPINFTYYYDDQKTIDSIDWYHLIGITINGTSYTGWVSNNIDKTRLITTYVTSTGTWTTLERTGISLMYGEGADFIESQETYGINALLTFSAAINESATGTSVLAFLKNNIFGHGAYDSCPLTCAITYDTVRDAIMAHARDYSGEYSNPSDDRYFGSHYGNKGSGMNIKYASDPYWGEKAAANAYNRDLMFGAQDYESNTIGIKVTDAAIPIKKEPSDDSDTIYEIKNNYFLVANVPYIVIDRVKDEDGDYWYKVYTDVALDENQDITDDYYSFSHSYGYIKAEYLNVKNNQPNITASDITLEQGITPYDLMEGVTATDAEDGNITSNIDYTTNIDITQYGTYQVTYTVTDSQKFSVSKTVAITVYKSNTPVITASDKSVLQNTTFDPLAGVSVNDPNEGNITDKLVIDSNNVDLTKVGTYKIVYSVTNLLNIKTTKEITVTVLSNASPVIRAADIYMNVNDSLTYLENASAIDLEDGVITNKITMTNNIDKTKAGTYDLTYSVTDSNNNVVTKSIKVYVSSNTYTTKTGELYFNSLNYNPDTNMLEVSGSLAIIGIDNTKDTSITYDLILKNNVSGYEIVLPLERYLTNHPTTVYSDTTHSYTETWFKGSVSLKNVTKGEYTLYVRARSGNYESKILFNNLFLKSMTKKATDSDGRGYLFRNNNYMKEFPIELFVYENGLITTTEATSTANMFNTYSTIDLSSKYLKIVGNSFNMNGNYAESKTIERYIVFENITTEKRYSYNIGSFVGEELILRTNDGLSKARSWFDTKELVDVTKLPVGRYIIYLRTKSAGVDDFGELQDLFLNATDSVTLDGKKYSLIVNKNARFRVELLIE
ncbi:MAG: DUF5011 domain-containing protein [Bacilli bacterium]|nr:DUF5011 domain-containing protein [Bacilli bacterium]